MGLSLCFFVTYSQASCLNVIREDLKQKTAIQQTMTKHGDALKRAGVSTAVMFISPVLGMMGYLGTGLVKASQESNLKLLELSESLVNDDVRLPETMDELKQEIDNKIFLKALAGVSKKFLTLKELVSGKIGRDVSNIELARVILDLDIASNIEGLVENDGEYLAEHSKLQADYELGEEENPWCRLNAEDTYLLHTQDGDKLRIKKKGKILVRGYHKGKLAQVLSYMLLKDHEKDSSTLSTTLL